MDHLEALSPADAEADQGDDFADLLMAELDEEAPGEGEEANKQSQAGPQTEAPGPAKGPELSQNQQKAIPREGTDFQLPQTNQSGALPLSVKTQSSVLALAPHTEIKERVGVSNTTGGSAQGVTSSPNTPREQKGACLDSGSAMPAKGLGQTRSPHGKARSKGTVIWRRAGCSGAISDELF